MITVIHGAQLLYRTKEAPHRFGFRSAVTQSLPQGTTVVGVVDDHANVAMFAQPGELPVRVPADVVTAAKRAATQSSATERSEWERRAIPMLIEHAAAHGHQVIVIEFGVDPETAAAVVAASQDQNRVVFISEDSSFKTSSRFHAVSHAALVTPIASAISEEELPAGSIIVRAGDTSGRTTR